MSGRNYHKRQFAIARNKHKRPTLQHVTIDFDQTVCGQPMGEWGTRVYTARPMLPMLCLKCAKIEGIDVT